MVWVDAPPGTGKLVAKALSSKAISRPVTSALSDVPTAKEVREMCEPVGAVAVVHVRQRGAAQVLMVLNGADGTPLETYTMRPGKKPLKALPADVTKGLLRALALAKAPGKGPARVIEEPASAPDEPEVAGPQAAPPPPKPEPTRATPRREEPEPRKVVEVTPAPVEAAEAPTEIDPATAPIALAVQVGFRGFSRQLRWFNSPGDDPKPFSNPFVAGPAMDVSWYPAAKLTTGVLANLGIHGVLETTLGSPTRLDTTGEPFATNSTRWRLEAVLRFAFLTRLELGFQVGVISHSFTFGAVSATSGRARPLLPGVTYLGPRGGATFAVNIVGPLSLQVFGGVIAVAGTGELGVAPYFPRAGGFGFDVGATARMRFADGFMFSVTGDFHRYVMRLNPIAGGALTATGSTDQFLSVTAAVGYAL